MSASPHPFAPLFEPLTAAHQLYIHRNATRRDPAKRLRIGRLAAEVQAIFDVGQSAPKTGPFGDLCRELDAMYVGPHAVRELAKYADPDFRFQAAPTPDQVKEMLWQRGTSLAALARETGLDRRDLGRALQPDTVDECRQAIARALDTTPYDLWPDDYGPSGQRRVEARRQKTERSAA